MKKIIYLILVLVLMIPLSTKAKEDKVNAYLFYGEGCPHCHLMNEYLSGKEDINLYKYEVWNNEENYNHLENVGRILENNSLSVPYLVIGNTTIVGYNEALSPGRIDDVINYYKNTLYEDKTGIYLNIVKDEVQNIDKINLNKNVKDFAKTNHEFLSSITLGALQSFTLPSIITIILIVSIVLLINDKFKRYLAGIIFIFLEQLIYYLFLVSKIDTKYFMDKMMFVKFFAMTLLIIFLVFTISRYSNNKLKFSNKKYTLYLSLVSLLSVSLSIIVIYYFPKLYILFKETLLLNSTLKQINVYSTIYSLVSLSINVLIFTLLVKVLSLKKVSSMLGNKLYLINFLIIIVNILLIYFINLIV